MGIFAAWELALADPRKLENPGNRYIFIDKSVLF
jgi:hypothetical protein